MVRKQEVFIRCRLLIGQFLEKQNIIRNASNILSKRTPYLMGSDRFLVDEIEGWAFVHNDKIYFRSSSAHLYKKKHLTIIVHF